MEETETKEEAKEEKKKRKYEFKRMKKLGKAGHGFFADFKKFINKGNIVNLAVAVVIGAAFTAIVSSLVDDMFMPLINLMLGKNEISELHFTISSTPFYYGRFIAATIKFFLVALVLFFVIKAMINAEKGFGKLRYNKKKEEAAADASPPPPPPPAIETTEEILKDIRDLLRKENTTPDKDTEAK